MSPVPGAFVRGAALFCLLSLLPAPAFAEDGDASQASQASYSSYAEKDPWEVFNRKTYAFNDWLDRSLLHPVGKVYRDHAPRSVQIGAGNFFYNLSEPRNILNSLLQWRIKDTIKHTARLLINTTIGMGGLVDIATPMGLTRGAKDKTMGHTLQKWGVSSGPYVMLPFLGPSTMRDALGSPVDGWTNGVSYFEPETSASLLAWRTVDQRAKIPEVQGLLGADPYITFRELYFSRRASLFADDDSPEDAQLRDEQEAEAIFDDDF